MAQRLVLVRVESVVVVVGSAPLPVLEGQGLLLQEGVVLPGQVGSAVALVLKVAVVVSMPQVAVVVPVPQVAVVVPVPQVAVVVPSPQVVVVAVEV